MSSGLPNRPSLEHLKKQARERLRELRVRVPGTRLADAQHAVAREYWFPSWPKLKAHVDAVNASNSAVDPGFLAVRHRSWQPARRHRSMTTSRIGCEQHTRRLPSAGLSSGSGP